MHPCYASYLNTNLVKSRLILSSEGKVEIQALLASFLTIFLLLVQYAFSATNPWKQPVSHSAAVTCFPVSLPL